MDRIFQIGNFSFRLICPENIMPPENFMKFVQADYADGTVEMENKPEYTYNIKVSEKLPKPTGTLTARRPDLLVFKSDIGENRLMGIKGRDSYYAYYQEVADDRAEIILAANQIEGLHIDPVFTSLMALERRFVKKDNMVLHCAYVVYKGKAILFSAPSETGKTTQAGLWEEYMGSRTVNGDRSLLGKKDGRWLAQGWPVCGTSEICHNETFPIQAVVMLSQAPENHVKHLTPGQAFPLLYSQITVNKWNAAAHLHMIDLMEDFLTCVPVFHLGCTISREAVSCLASALSEIDGI